MSLALAAALSQSIVPRVDLPPPQEDPCAGFEEAEDLSGSGQRAFTLDDQVRMADIGRANPVGAARAFGVAPDGEHIAFVVKRANPEANGYCQRLMIATMDGSGAAVEVDRGGEFIRDDFRLRDFPAIMGGWDRPNPPRWSPNGSQIGYLKRLNGSTQVWLVDPGGLAMELRCSLFKLLVGPTVRPPFCDGSLARRNRAKPCLPKTRWSDAWWSAANCCAAAKGSVSLAVWLQSMSSPVQSASYTIPIRSLKIGPSGPLSASGSAMLSGPKAMPILSCHRTTRPGNVIPWSSCNIQV